MKIKHNKKRNTAFLFETLVRELTKSIVEQDHSRSGRVKNILSEHFRQGMVLFSELDCFRSLTDHETALDHYTAEKMIHRSRRAYDELDREEVFREQSQVIKKVNSELGKETFNNFVPNYKSYATLAQIFGNKTSVKNRVLLEKRILKNLTESAVSESQIQPVDVLVVDKFVDRFNEKYKTLLPEQQELLKRFTLSNAKEDLDFRLYVGEELKRLHSLVTESLSLEEVKSDESMVEGTSHVLKLLENIKVASLSSDDIMKVLKVQQLASEYTADAN
jgi:hypothetical protein